MIPELGTMALLLASLLFFALACSPLQQVLPLFASLASVRTRLLWMGSALVLVALGIMEYSLLSDDFSLDFVARNSSTQLPNGYKMTALWGAHEGSMLLWLLVLSGCASLFALRQRSVFSLGLFGFLLGVFCLFTLATSNPFARLLPLAPAEGGDLNPLLQNPLMAIHPPILYIGYLALAPVYIEALRLIVQEQPLDIQKLRRALRFWCLLAWIFLTAGIALGSFWAYTELGWGGWWFWDPVENVSLIPWILATALLHMLRHPAPGSLEVKIILTLALGGFSTALFGAMVVRSGLLVSVHSFAADPSRGVFLLSILGLSWIPMVLIPLAKIKSLGESAALGTFNLNTWVGLQAVISIAAAATLLCGVLYPPLYSLVSDAGISVGAPYFEQTVVPMALAAVLLMGTAPALRWRRSRKAPWRLWLVMALVASAVLVLCWALQGDGFLRAWPAVVSTWLATWVLTGFLATGWEGGRGKDKSRRKGPQLSMVLAHLGFVCVVLAAGWETSMGVSKEVALSPGETLDMGATQWTLVGDTQVQGPNWNGTRLKLQVVDESGESMDLYPEKRFYQQRNQVMTEAAIHSLPSRDVYVAVGEVLEGQTWSVRAQIKPLLSLAWMGALLCVFGGLFAIRRERLYWSKK